MERVGLIGCFEDSQLRRRRRKLARGTQRFESDALVRPVAERLVRRLSAAAQPDHGSSAKAERIAVGIVNGELAFHSNRAVIEDGNFR